MHIRVGIDDMAVFVPRLFLDFTKEFAESRKVDVNKLKKGVGIEQMAVADVNEDAATLAAEAIYRLIRKSSINPDRIGKIYIGTESGVDESKAMGGYVIGMLEKALGDGTLQECGTVEFKFACIGTSYALDAAASWVSSDRNDDKIAIVVASDIAKYEMFTSGEATQGAGAVAMAVTEKPRLLLLDDVNAYFTKDENDFFRPIGKQTAVFDSEHSVNCYLNSMKAVTLNYGKKAVKSGLVALHRGETVSDKIDYTIFHIPFPRMAEYAAAFLFRHEWRGLERWKEVEATLGPEPKPADFKTTEEYLAADQAYRKKFTKHPMFVKAFSEKVEPSVQLSRRIGNIYTGSLYLGLQSLLEVEHAKGKDLTGKRVGFGSYGSGCSALAFSGVVRPRYKEIVSKMNLLKELDERMEIDLAHYEMRHDGKLKEPIAKKDGFVLKEIGADGYRHYDYVPVGK